MASKPKLGNRIAEVRRERELKQAELARRVGVSAPEMSRIENGERTMDRHWLLRIAAAFPCDPWELLPEWGERSAADHIRDLFMNLDETTRLGLITELAAGLPQPAAKLDKTLIPHHHSNGSTSKHSVVVMGPMQAPGQSGIKVAEVRHSPDGTYTVAIFAAPASTDEPENRFKSKRTKKLLQPT